MSNKQNSVSRRSFLKSSTTTAIGVTAFHIVPGKVFGSPKRLAPSDEILTGHIGIGGRGSNFLRPGQSIALCDVDSNRLANAAKRVGGSPKTYNDYRDLLDDNDVDAVFIASPDHWHGLHTIHACQAGKDVYVEKPACKTIEEGRAMVTAAKRYARIVQVGSQGRSQEGAYYGCQYVQNGQIGKVNKVTCWHYANPKGNWTPNSAPPKELDYNKWIGPNRWIPYNPTRTHGRFRWMLDFGGGQIRDRGAHVMSVAMWVMNSDHTGPAIVESTGHPHFDGLYTTPEYMNVTYSFKDPDWTLVWAMPGEPEMKAQYGAKYWGEKDTLVITYGDGPHTRAEQKAFNYTPPSDGVHVYKSPNFRHRDDFERSIRTREQPIMNIEAGHRVATLCILGNISYELGRKLEWDPVTEKVKNDDEANRLLSRPGRGEFHI
jgi:predicted dehydrogenase